MVTPTRKRTLLIVFAAAALSSPAPAQPTLLAQPTRVTHAARLAQPTRLAPQTATLQPAAAAYLAQAVGTMQAHYYARDGVDWAVLYREAFFAARGAEVPADTYDAIRGALGRLSHSFLQLSDAARAEESSRRALRGLPELSRPASSPASSRFADRRDPGVDRSRVGGQYVGRIEVPSFAGSTARAIAYATTLQDGIRVADGAGVCGWIVDLRGNGGGNMWPMLVGVGPVLGEGIVGGLSIGGHHAGNWFYRDGVAGMDGGDGFIGSRIPGEAYRVEGAPAVAVLIDGGTGSSGEAVAIAFKGRPGTRFFGEPSAGYSTATDGFRLPDGANLVIAVGVDVDRTGIEYPGQVVPDVVVSGPAREGAPDGQLAAAHEWLSSGACAKD